MAAPLRQTARGTNGNSRGTAPLVSTADASVLPQDLLYEILVRLPAKRLCHLRAVCRSWLSLISDSFFIVAHSARHGPLVAAFKREPAGVHILDTSGHTVRHIRLENYPQNHNSNEARTNLDLFCIIGKEPDKRPHVIEPATGVVSLLPDDSEFYHDGNFTNFALGRASLTREAKVLAVTDNKMQVSSCKVLTLGGAGGWRDTGCPPTPLLLVSSRCVALVELSDSLVAVYGRSNDDQICDVFMDLWFLTDSEKVLWSKRYTITIPYQGFPRPHYDLLWALDDEKLVFWVSPYDKMGEVHSLRVYDSRTNTCTDGAQLLGYDFLGVYNGSLLACW